MSKSIDPISGYINNFPKQVQGRLNDVRRIIKEEIPEGEEVISYQMPAVKILGHIVVYYASWKKHLALYPFFEEMAQELGGLENYPRSGKGTIQFPHNMPLPEKIIREIVRIRLRSVENKYKK